MKPARTRVETIAIMSRMRRRRFHRLRWGSKNICLSGMDGLVYLYAETIETVYAIHYESYGSRSRESIDSFGPDLWPRGPGAAGGAGACRGRCVARVDAQGAFSGQWGHADLRRAGKESAAAWTVCADRERRRGVFDADPAARLSAVSGALFQGFRDGKLRLGGVGADRAGAAGLPASGGVCAPHCAA